jgi:hypothetical protein
MTLLDEPAQPESGEAVDVYLSIPHLQLMVAHERLRRERAEASLTAAQQRIAALHAALRTYGWHKPECDYMQEELPCTCGFLAALAPKEPT